MGVPHSPRRRTLGAALAALALLAVAPVLGDHLVPAGTASLTLRSTADIGALCLVALHILLAPVHGLLHGALAAGVTYAVWDRARAWRAMRRLLALADPHPPRHGGAVWSAARSAGVALGRVRVMDELPNVAFTAGWLRPRIYISRELARRLAPAELRAVLAHEGAHVARRDPLRLSLLRFAACALFWLPALRRLVHDLADEVELAADDRAAGEEPLVLASAILSVARWTRRSVLPAGSAALVTPDLVERRVRRLAGEPLPSRSRATPRSLAAAALVLALAWGAGAIGSRPLAGEGASPAGGRMAMMSCWQHAGPVVLHLICAGPPFGAPAARCPHMKGDVSSAPVSSPTSRLVP